MNELKEFDLSKERWREYEWFGGIKDSNGEVMRVYRIDNPQKLFVRDGGRTHRVVDDKGIAHCIPTVGYLGCALRWENKDHNKPVNF